LIRVHTNRAIFLRGASSESVAYARANPTEVEGHPDWKMRIGSSYLQNTAPIREAFIPHTRTICPFLEARLVAKLEINADFSPKQSSGIVVSKVRRRKPKELTPDELIRISPLCSDIIGMKISVIRYFRFAIL